MHATRLLELGARIALNGPPLVRRRGQLSPTGLNEYWTASRVRLERWRSSLARLAPGVGAEPVRGKRWSAELRPLLEEIFTGELLTRVWTAVAIACAKNGVESDCEPLLRSVLLNHLEVRNEALNCLVFGIGPETRQIVELQQIRRRVERWIDFLFGEMQREMDVADFAYDPRRARDYARSPRIVGQPNSDDGETPEERILSSLRSSFDEILTRRTLFPELNQAVAAGVLGSIAGDWLESLDWHPDQWRERLDLGTHDALVWIDEALGLDEPRRRPAPPS